MLTEALTALAVVAVLALALYLGMAYGTSATAAERENLRATQIVLNRMEGIRLFTWDQLVDPALNPGTFTEYFLNTGTNRGVQYNGTVVVSTNLTLSPPAAYSANMRMVTVQLTWTKGSATHRCQMSTYVSKNGVQNYIFNN